MIWKSDEERTKWINLKGSYDIVSINVGEKMWYPDYGTVKDFADAKEILKSNPLSSQIFASTFTAASIVIVRRRSHESLTATIFPSCPSTPYIPSFSNKLQEFSKHSPTPAPLTTLLLITNQHELPFSLRKLPDTTNQWLS